MADENKENKDMTVAASEPAMDNQPQAQVGMPYRPEVLKEHLKKSRGEKVYDWAVYGGINYWINLALSVWIADEFKNGKAKPFFDKMISKSANLLSGTKLISAEKALHHSKVAWETSALTSGGWMVLVPMKILEDHKRGVVHWLNEHLGTPNKSADGKDLTADEIYIKKEQPKQSWPRVVGRRFLAWGSVIVSGHAIEHTVGKEKTTDWIVNKANKVFNSGYVPGGKSIIASPRLQRYLGFTALDAIFTRVSAIVMHLTNGAKKAHMPHEIGNEDPPYFEVKTNGTHLVPDEQAMEKEADCPTGKCRTVKALTGQGRKESFVSALTQKSANSPELGINT